MKRILIGLAVLAALILPVYAGEAQGTGAKAAETKMTGWISDSNCGAKNANAEGASCARMCIKSGAKAVFVAGEKIFTIKGDAKAYIDHTGKELEVTGVVDGDTIEIKSIKPAGAKA